MAVLRLALAVLLVAAPAAALTGGAGENGAEFLSLRPGARALGMAEAYGPVAEGPDSMYWNPAGLAAIERPEFSFTRTQYLRVFTHDYYAVAAPVAWSGGTLGFAATVFQEDTTPVLDKNGVEAGKFRPHSEAFSLGYGRVLIGGGETPERPDDTSTWDLPGTVSPRSRYDDPWNATLAVGVAAKTIYQRYYTVRATAFAFDAGLTCRPPALRGMSLSAAARNLGSTIKLTQERNHLPAELSLGAAYDARLEEHHRFLPSLELHLPYYGRASAGLGFEYSRHSRDAKTRLAYRVGYNTNATYEQSPLAGITTGLGLGIGALSADFAFQPMDALGDVFRISLGWRF